ncbi:hypothetical protein EDD85DRAFT_961386 [Armillaria nabsnona]|nr:hypothetical protein EDD85DRAFT_961386 [Armillaria nabsnona]
MQEERNWLRYIVSHSSTLTFIVSVSDVGRPRQSQHLYTRLNYACLGRSASIAITSSLWPGICVIEGGSRAATDALCPFPTKADYRADARSTIEGITCYDRDSSSGSEALGKLFAAVSSTASEKAERREKGPSITNSAEAMALHQTSLPLLLPVTSSTLLHHWLTWKGGRGRMLGSIAPTAAYHYCWHPSSTIVDVEDGLGRFDPPPITE